MEDITEHIDRIILEKEYAQLSSDELAQIQEFIANEIEYNDFRHTLQAVRAQYANEIEVEPSSEVKDKLLAQFEHYQKTGKTFGSSSGIAYFFPSEKQFFAKPGIQILMAAAAIALLIGFIFNFSLDINRTEVAMDTQKNKEQVAPSMLEENEITPAYETIVEDNHLATDDLPSEESSATSVVIEKSDMNAKTMNTKPIEQYALSEGSASKEAEMADETTPVPSTITFTSTMANTTTGSGVSDNMSFVTESNTRQVAKTTADKKKATSNEAPSMSVSASAPPKKSKTLSENADLISYFYTTM
jgi:hypothetical protein